MWYNPFTLGQSDHLVHHGGYKLHPAKKCLGSWKNVRTNKISKDLQSYIYYYYYYYSHFLSYLFYQVFTVLRPQNFYTRLLLQVLSCSTPFQALTHFLCSLVCCRFWKAAAERIFSLSSFEDFLMLKGLSLTFFFLLNHILDINGVFWSEGSII